MGSAQQKNIISILCGLCFFCSCREYSQGNTGRLLGEWQSTDKECMEAYVFRAAGTCIYTPGYFIYEDELKPTMPEFFVFIDDGISSINRFLGSETDYELRGDSLSIYNLETGCWDAYTIRFGKRDTLLLWDNDREKCFVKKRYKSDKQPLFDQVILSVPIRQIQAPFDYVEKRISLSRSGELIYHERCLIPWGGFSIMDATLEPGDFDFMETLFKRANIRSYLCSPPPREMMKSWWDEKLSITFVKDNKMVTIEEPLKTFQSREFQWAYLTVLYADQRSHIVNTFDLDVNEGLMNRFIIDIDASEYEFLYLSGSEQFYLLTLLYHAEETDRDFEGLYHIGKSSAR